MPIAVAFSKKINVIGFDLNTAKIELYKNGIDPTNEVGNEAIKACAVEFTADETRLRDAKFLIVAVPTPVNDDHTQIDVTNIPITEEPVDGNVFDIVVTTRGSDPEGELVNIEFKDIPWEYV